MGCGAFIYLMEKTYHFLWGGDPEGKFHILSLGSLLSMQTAMSNTQHASIYNMPGLNGQFRSPVHT